jgi:hypothetical protein
VLVLAPAVEITCSGPYARPDERSSGHAAFGYCSDRCAAQCANAGAAKRALLGCGHVCASAETNRDDNGDDWKSMSHGRTPRLSRLVRHFDPTADPQGEDRSANTARSVSRHRIVQ